MLKPSVQIHKVDGFLVAEFWDCLRLDPVPIQDIRKHYETHLRSKGKPELVIDLLGVGFAGSAALGHFVALHKLARQKGGRLIFCNVDPTVFEAFRVSKLDPLFTFVSDRPAALKSAEAPEPGRPSDKTDAPPADASTPSAPAKPSAPSPLGGLRRKKST